MKSSDVNRATCNLVIYFRFGPVTRHARMNKWNVYKNGHRNASRGSFVITCNIN